MLTAPSFLTDNMGLLLEGLLSSVPGFVQMAAVKALSLDKNVAGDMIKEYEHRRNILISGSNSISGFSCLLP